MEDWSRAMTLEGIRSIRFEWRTHTFEDKFSLILFWRVFFFVASSMGRWHFGTLWISETDIYSGVRRSACSGATPCGFSPQLSCAVSLWMCKNPQWSHRNHSKNFPKITLGASVRVITLSPAQGSGLTASLACSLIFPSNAAHAGQAKQGQESLEIQQGPWEI